MWCKNVLDSSNQEATVCGFQKRKEDATQCKIALCDGLFSILYKSINTS